MGYLCMDCGNDDRFKGYQDITRYETEEIFMDGESGEIVDWRSCDLNDSDITTDPYDIECEHCGSDNVRYFAYDEEDERQTAREQILTNGSSSTVNNDVSVSSWKKAIED